MKNIWISVDDRLPDEGVIVWVTNGKWVSLANYVYHQNEGWFWEEVDASGLFIEDGKLNAIDGELDDYDIQFWHPAPDFSQFLKP